MPGVVGEEGSLQCPSREEEVSEQGDGTHQAGGAPGPGLRHSVEKVDEAGRARAEVWDGARAM